MEGQTNGQIFTQYSGISSHSLRGVWIVQSICVEIMYRMIQQICNNVVINGIH
jgi:hypothetical protein